MRLVRVLFDCCSGSVLSTNVMGLEPEGAGMRRTGAKPEHESRHPSRAHHSPEESRVGGFREAHPFVVFRRDIGRGCQLTGGGIRLAACSSARGVPFGTRPMENAMKLVRSMITVVAMLVVLPVQAATTDPEIILYRFAGVRDNGTMGTAFICTNFSGVTETIRVVVRTFDGTIKANSALQVTHLRTQAMTTRGIALYGAFDLVTGDVQGTAAIAATSPHIQCNAIVLESAPAAPNAFTLRGVRFNPIPATEE
jgi:hypothetical protein